MYEVGDTVVLKTQDVWIIESYDEKEDGTIRYTLKKGKRRVEVAEYSIERKI